MRVVVCGTGTDVGKTHVAVALTAHLRRAGRRVIGLKPITAGGDDDAARLGEAAGVLKLPLFAFREPVSPHLAARRARRSIDVAAIERWVADATHGVEVCIIETAGGLFSPLAPGVHNGALVRALVPDAVVLVAPDRLGVLHDVTATTLAAAAAGLAAMTLALSAPESADASSGSNARELVRLGLAPAVTLFPREPVDAPATRRAAARLWAAL